VTALTAARPAANPSELLTLLNTVMYKNIRERLVSDDHVTFVLLRVFEDGRVLFAGSHEDLIVRRAKAGTCEIIPTLGTWLGAVPNIKASTVDLQVRLDPGDLLVAFIDGLIESRNEVGDMFGLERLLREIAKWGEHSTDELCDRIWATVQAWCACPEDDLSLLALRFDSSRTG
jgi:sigma-B regulation protein RsbU (phosphoserine phosphatase)